MPTGLHSEIAPFDHHL